MALSSFVDLTQYIIIIKQIAYFYGIRFAFKLDKNTYRINIKLALSSENVFILITKKYL